MECNPLLWDVLNNLKTQNTSTTTHTAQDTTDRKVIKKWPIHKTITSSHTMRRFHLIFNTLSPHNLLFEPHTGEINEQDENQEEFVTKRTKYFELCLVDFEMCGPDIL